MKRKIFLSITAALLALVLCVAFTACTMTEKDPSKIDEKAELTGAGILAENGTWYDLSLDKAEKLFSMVKNLGELNGEALDVAISGSSTIKTTYDYSFKLAYQSGNFFVRKKSEFTYNVGERFVRTYTDGKVNERYNEDKLVVKRAVSKDTATLSKEQLALVQEIFESMNAEIMSNAFEKVASDARAAGYSVEEIAKDTLADKLIDILGSSPLYADENLLKGYTIVTGDGENHIFLCASLEWAEELDSWRDTDRVGRVFYIAGSYADTIKTTLTE